MTADPAVQPAREETGAPRPDVDLPSVSLPKGGGALRGIGEKFSTNPANGTATLSIPLPVSPGRSGFQPSLALAYDSGAGNGPFGIGWRLSAPAITRKTDKGLPQYLDAQESDVYQLAGAEDLVPMLRADGSRWVDPAPPPGFTIHRYRPRLEGSFAKIERWTADGTGEIHWRTTTSSNVVTVYGSDDSCRIRDPDAPLRIFSWLAAQVRDDKGNAAVYDYVAEDAVAVDVGQASERNRARGANRYVKRVRYGNQVSTLVQPDLSAAHWLFEVVFDYDENHCLALRPDPSRSVDEQLALATASVDPQTPWTARPDPFSRYRSGFEVRTYRRCRRVLMFHHVPDQRGQPGYDGLVRAMELGYDDLDLSTGPSVDEELAAPGSTRFGSVLTSATQSSYRPDRTVAAAGAVVTYITKALPSLTISYSRPSIRDDVLELDTGAKAQLPIGVDGAIYRLVDLEGEGLAGVLSDAAGSWNYQRSLGGGHFDAPRRVLRQPSVAGPRAAGIRLMDLGGTGRLDAVALAGPTPGWTERTDDDWTPYRAFDSAPAIDWAQPNVRLVDLTGDGLSDVLVTEQEVFTWYAGLGTAGFGPGGGVHQPWDEEQGPRVVFADDTESIHLADMSGDGLSDLVRIRHGETCYWPNLGYGRFGARVVLDNSPVFDNVEQFEDRRLHLVDATGSGTTDIVYAGRGGVALYLNQSGSRLSAARLLTRVPAPTDPTVLTTGDLLGTGTPCLIWSSPLQVDAEHPLRFLDLMNSTPAHLLTGVDNSCGATTEVEYAPSTSFFLADRAAGRPWVTRLPFPVQVVSRSVTRDSVSGNRFGSRFAYHHGCFDGFEREFRGFGMVEQWDTEEYAALDPTGAPPSGNNLDASSDVPPMLTRTWFHTGVAAGRDQLLDYYAGLLGGGAPGEFYREPGRTQAQARALLLGPSVLPPGLTPDEEREACRALKGSVLRREIYGLDGSTRAEHPYAVTGQNATVRLVQPRLGNRHAVFLTTPREALDLQYDREPSDPRTRHTVNLLTDGFGNVLQAATIGYGRRVADPTLDAGLRAEQARTRVTVTTNAVTNPTDQAGAWRVPAPCESRVEELTGFAAPVDTQRLSFEALTSTVGGATAIGYEQVPTGATAQLRLLSQHRIYFLKDDLSGLAPLGVLAPLALPGETFTLALTPPLLASVYGSRVDATMLELGGYVHTEGDTSWWAPSGRDHYSPGPIDSAGVEKAYAAAHFYRPLRHRDPFHTAAFSTESRVAYDGFDLLLSSTTDALGSTARIERQDYRVLAPSRLADINGNESEVAYDVHGSVVGTALMGKPAPAPVEGDSLVGFVADLTQAQIESFLADPTSTAATLLADASTCIIHNPYATMRDPAGNAPVVTATLVREVHVSDLPPGQRSPVHLSLAFADGAGRQAQTKALVDPGPVPARDGAGVVLLGPDGQPQLTAGGVAPRWVASGWTVLNNKGLAVRTFESFFSERSGYEPDGRVGVSPITFYDPLGRTAGVLHPDHTWEKATYDVWRAVAWDAVDTLLLDPATDPDLAGYFTRLPQTDYLPSWAALRTDPTHAAEAALRWPDPLVRADEQQAAVRAVVNVLTPVTTYADSLGRTVLSVADNVLGYAGAPPVQESYTTRTVLDVQGNRRLVVDPLGRLAATYDYDMLGRQVHRSSMDAGERWSLPDVVNGTFYGWDGMGTRVTTSYDQLRRPTDSLVSHGGGDLLVGRTTYGEAAPGAAAANLRGRVLEVRDQSGTVSSEIYDYAGNLVRSGRRTADDFASTLDWSGPVSQGVLLVSSTRYDGLGRIVAQTSPHLDRPDAGVEVTQYRYGSGTRLTQVDAWLQRTGEPAGLLDPGTADLRAVTTISYDAMGRRQSIGYGNGVSTDYTFDFRTGRVTAMVTRRPNAGYPGDCPAVPDPSWPGCQLQSCYYAYDPVGNVVSIRDTAQQSVFFRNRRVSADVQFVYDAMSRLLEASGREHLGQTGVPIPHSLDDSLRTLLPHPADGQAMARYSERFDYDAVGNLLSLRHRGTDPAHPGWSRTYSYAETSPLESADTGNRLTACMVAGATETYSSGGDGYDSHGNLLKMPHLQTMQWDYTGHLRMVQRQAVADGGANRSWYVYDATGHRTRVVTVTAAGAILEDRRYYGGFEAYNRAGADPVGRETLHVMAGALRVALVERRTGGVEPGVPQTLVRYQLADHLGSSSIVLDPTAAVISYEEYTPYGSTSFQSVRSQNEAPKRYRFTGTERDDGTGLQHNGARYYASWLGRWVSADPGGVDAAISLYGYCSGNPTSRTDTGGMQDPPTTAVGLTIGSGGVTVGPFVVPAPRGDPSLVVAFGPTTFQGRPSSYMGLAERNTGLTAINIQDRINLGRGLGLRWGFESFRQEGAWASGNRPDNGGLYPMFSGVMTQQALEGTVAGTVHFDMRDPNMLLTPPLLPAPIPMASTESLPGMNTGDFHTASEARQVVAHLAATDPGERNVTVVIHHEDGISTIVPESNTVQGAALPSRLADRVPNLTNPTGSTGGTTPTTGGGTGSAGASAGSDDGATPSAGGGGGRPGTGGGGGRSGGSGGSGGPSAVTGPTMMSSGLGALGRSVPGVAEAESALLGLAYSASGTWAAPLTAPLMTAATALPVAAGAGVGGAAVGLGARSAALAAGASPETANTIGFGTAMLTGAALGSFIPGVGTATGALIGLVLAGGLYLWATW